MVWNFNLSTLPTQAASIQWAFGKSCFLRLNLVLPPLAVETLSNVLFKVFNNIQRVELTAAASFKGDVAWVSICFNKSGFPDKKSLTSRLLLT